MSFLAVLTLLFKTEILDILLNVIGADVADAYFPVHGDQLLANDLFVKRNGLGRQGSALDLKKLFAKAGERDSIGVVVRPDSLQLFFKILDECFHFAVELLIAQILPRGSKDFGACDASACVVTAARDSDEVGTVWFWNDACHNFFLLFGKIGLDFAPTKTCRLAQVLSFVTVASILFG